MPAFCCKKHLQFLSRKPLIWKWTCVLSTVLVSTTLMKLWRLPLSSVCVYACMQEGERGRDHMLGLSVQAAWSHSLWSAGVTVIRLWLFASLLINHGPLLCSTVRLYSILNCELINSSNCWNERSFACIVQSCLSSDGARRKVPDVLVYWNATRWNATNLLIHQSSVRLVRCWWWSVRCSFFCDSRESRCFCSSKCLRCAKNWVGQRDELDRRSHSCINSI